jgi:hypothetical protein
MRAWAIRNQGLAGASIDGREPPLGAYLKAFDVDAADGYGTAEWTTDQAEALTYLSFSDAAEAWRRQSTVRPFRPDGRPNRPLTAFSCEISLLGHQVPPAPADN